MRTYRIKTKVGWRNWQADDAAHAREQHVDAFGDDDPFEKIQKVEEVKVLALGSASKTKKSSSQLNREIAAALKSGGSRGRKHSTIKKDHDWAAFTEGAAKAFWASPYITEVENLHESAREASRREDRLQIEAAYEVLSPGPGGAWEGVMPEPPASAKAVAKKFTKAVRDKLSAEQLDEIFGAFSAEDAGYYGAMQSQGEGVGWFNEGVRVDPPRGFEWDPKLQNAIQAAISRQVREAGIKLPRR